MSKEWYSVNEVADILGESYKKIYNLVVSGELGHYRVGRSYRIRKADLEAYFAKQAKQLHPTFVQPTDTSEAIVLDIAELVAVHAHESTFGQERPLTLTTELASTHVPESEARSLLANESSARDSLSMTAMTDQAVYSRSVRQYEVEFTTNFQQLFHNGLAVSHPMTGEIIRLTDWSIVEQVEDDLLQLGQLLSVSVLRPEQQMNYPNNVRILYWIEPNSLGGILRKYPNEGLVIECAVLTRIERFVNVGHDEEKLHWSHVEQELQERRMLVQRWSMRYGASIAYLVGLASPTGWDEESIERIRSYSDNARILPYLIDFIDLNVYSSYADKKSSEYLELFELALGERKIRRIQQQVRGLLLATSAMRLADLQAQIGCSQGLIREACIQLAKSNPDYTILQEGSNLIIRNG